MAKKKTKLFDHFAAARKEQHGAMCTRSMFCATLETILRVSAEDKRRPGIELAPFFQIGTGKRVSSRVVYLGKRVGSRVVYFARQTEYVELVHCPFCGERINLKTKAVKKGVSNVKTTPSDRS